MLNNKKYIIAFAVALLLPLSFFLIAKFLKKDQVKLPAYYLPINTQKIMREGQLVIDTNYHQIHDFIAQNQMGDTISLNKNLKNKCLVVDFIFTNCTTTCPILTSHLLMLQNAYKKTAMKQNDEIVQFISISIDPERDSISALRLYADLHHANNDHWWFLRTNKKAVIDFAQELHLISPENEGGVDDNLHSDKIVLIDQERYVRGYYTGTDKAAIQKCAYDIGLLFLEKKKK